MGTGFHVELEMDSRWNWGSLFTLGRCPREDAVLVRTLSSFYVGTGFTLSSFYVGTVLRLKRGTGLR